MVRPLSAEQSLKLGFSFNKNLYSNLDIYRQATINQDYDCVVLIDGGEGKGKSVLGMQVGYMLDKDNHIDIETQICYTPEQLKKAITTLPKHKAIIFDEARRGFNRRRSTQDVNIDLTDLFAECRQNNLFLIIIMPTFYDMDMNMAVWRSRILIHVKSAWDLSNKEKPLLRGFARLYTEQGKMSLYTNKLWRMQYRYPLITNESFDFTFPHFYVVDEQVYRDKKRFSEEFYRNKNKSVNKYQDLVGAVDFLKKNKYLKSGAITALINEFLGVTEQAWSKYKSKLNSSKDTL